VKGIISLLFVHSLV